MVDLPAWVYPNHSQLSFATAYGRGTVETSARWWVIPRSVSARLSFPYALIVFRKIALHHLQRSV